MGKGGNGLDLRAAQELRAGERGAVVACVGEIDRGGVLDGGEEGDGDNVDGRVCVVLGQEVVRWQRVGQDYWRNKWQAAAGHYRRG